ncbi:MAG: TldD/PmbA family protein [archaeon GB-1867-005]|nr:TldD/PmbA family protein [Candidatus Culexmicrobium cathedralense]
MEDLARKAIETALSAGATYADIRIVEQKWENITTRNAKVRVVDAGSSMGFGVRAIADGAWGFASHYELTPTEVVKVALKAVEIARASAKVKKKDVKLAPVKPVRDTYKTPIIKDPFKVPLEDKIELLTESDKRILSKGELIKVATSSMRIYRENKIFSSSEGAFITQEITWCGVTTRAVAVGYGEVQDRSYDGRNFNTGGYEIIEEVNLPEKAEKSGEEAIALLTAKNCPTMITDLIIGGSQLALQIHESCGHPTELDRVLGTEASYAGTSFLTPEKLGKFRYGSDKVTIVADATAPRGLGTFGYDDEGVPAQKVYLVKEGIFVGYLTDRASAAELGLPSSTGAARASSWNRIPLVRMTNINLEPGDWDFEELIQETKKGVYVETNRSWSIDDKRLNFQFGTQIAYLIENGEFKELLKNAIYTGITPEFWRSCDAVCNEKYWTMWGTPGCGKGEPGQVMYVGHGTAPARFKNIRVGVGKW